MMRKLRVACVHEDDFFPGEPRLESIHPAMENVDHVLIFISPANVNDKETGHVFRLAFDKSIKTHTNYLIVVKPEALDVSENKPLHAYSKYYVCMDTENLSEQKIRKAMPDEEF